MVSKLRIIFSGLTATGWEGKTAPTQIAVPPKGSFSMEASIAAVAPVVSRMSSQVSRDAKNASKDIA